MRLSQLIRQAAIRQAESDMGQGFNMPSRSDVEKMSSRDLSEFIDELKNEF